MKPTDKRTDPSPKRGAQAKANSEAKTQTKAKTARQPLNQAKTAERALKAASRDKATEAVERVSAALVERATAEGLVDVAYARVESPFGELLAASTKRGLVRLHLPPNPSAEPFIADLAARVSPRVLELPARLDDVRRQLDEYFDGRRSRFELDLDWRLIRGFSRQVLRATAALGYGETATYTQVATKAGSPRAYRAAGNALHHNPIPIVIPCHRILHSGGGLGGYGGGLDMKRRLLRLEGALSD